MYPTDQWLAWIRTEKYKYVRGIYNPDIPEELYDVGVDPNEKDNLIETLPEVAGELRRNLAALMEPDHGEPADINTEYSEIELDQLQGRLRDLGYLE